MSEDIDKNPSITTVVSSMREGKFQEEISEKFNDLVQQVIVHRKAGSITITLNVKPGEYADNDVVIFDNVTAKIPQPTKRPGIFFSDEEGVLSSENPKQQSLKLEEPVRGKANSKVVNIKNKKEVS